MKMGLVGICVAATVAVGARASEPTLFMGDAQSLGNGTIRSYVELDSDNRPLALGVRFSASALEGLPETRNATSRCFDFNGNGRIDETGECEGDTEIRMTIPSSFAQDPDNPFRWIGVNWNPEGHPPHAWSVAHFDFHFYMVETQAIDAIRVGPCPFFINCDDKVRASTPVPAQYVAEGHVDVGATVSMMGNHLIDSRAPELPDQPNAFTHTWIYGAYDGHIIFYEPMITRAYLRTRPDVCTAMRQPSAWEQPGYYPTKYCIRYRGGSDDYTVSLENFVRRNAQ